MTEFEKLARQQIAHQRKMDIARRLIKGYLLRYAGAGRSATVTELPTKPPAPGGYHVS